MQNNLLYGFKELSETGLFPLRASINLLKELNSSELNPLLRSPYTKQVDASCVLFERITRQFPKPEFKIKETIIGKTNVKVQEKVVLNKTFCNLVNFQKSSSKKLPKILIVAPMSGHYATLCRKTVEGLLPHFDVYITCWKNARDIPLTEGSFDMDDFINYCIEFFTELKSDLHVMAVCQPSAPVAAAVALMSSENHKSTPKSMILIGGPIDTRKNPTEVNAYAAKKPMSWFEKNVITTVPVNYKGYMRKVYPGFVQLSGFVSMNLPRHFGEHLKLYNNIVDSNEQDIDLHTKFYDEYFAVMDLPAEFYLQTIDAVFKSHQLPNGTMVSRGRKVMLSDVKKTSILVLEGELDDITGVGQTKVNLDLCNNLPKSMKKYSLQKDVGHFGLFSGSKFLKNILPEIIDFVRKSK